MKKQYESFMHKRFANLVKKMIGSLYTDEVGLAWLVKCHVVTVKSWVSGNNFPSRNYALVLASLSPEMKSFLNQLAKVDAAQARLAERSSESGTRRLKKVA